MLGGERKPISASSSRLAGIVIDPVALSSLGQRVAIDMREADVIEPAQFGDRPLRIKRPRARDELDHQLARGGIAIGVKAGEGHSPSQLGL